MSDEISLEVFGAPSVGGGKGFALGLIICVGYGLRSCFAVFPLAALGLLLLVVSLEFSASLVVKPGEVGEDVVGSELPVGNASVVAGAEALEVEHELVGI